MGELDGAELDLQSGIVRNPQSATGRGYPNGNPALGYNPASVRNTDSALPLHRKAPVVHSYASEGPAPGSLALRWTYGSNVPAKSRDPRVHVVQYNEDSFVLRENVCAHWEAPFTYLLFGNVGALLIDSGAMANAQHYPLRATVNFPEEQVTLDLGGRDILIWGSPGHVVSEFAYYDSYTQILFTGDMFYRGQCYISFWEPWFDSMKRLITFYDTHPVTHVMGCHVEISRDNQPMLMA